VEEKAGQSAGRLEDIADQYGSSIRAVSGETSLEITRRLNALLPDLILTANNV
jgi:hypothetical protein